MGELAKPTKFGSVTICELIKGKRGSFSLWSPPFFYFKVVLRVGVRVRVRGRTRGLRRGGVSRSIRCMVRLGIG